MYYPFRVAEFICTDPDCGERWSRRSQLAEGGECPECGAEARPLEAYDDEADELPAEEPAAIQPRIGFARDRARALVRDYEITTPPVPVEAIALRAELPVRRRAAMGSLRGRLVTDAIEVNGDDHSWVQRFSIAHELGHHFLETVHADGSPAESEADHFANELLVPGAMLREAMAGTTDLELLARRFQASRPVVKIAASHHRLPEPS